MPAAGGGLKGEGRARDGRATRDQARRRHLETAMRASQPDLFAASGVGDSPAPFADRPSEAGSAVALRARAAARGLDGLTDAEALQLLLCRSLSCGAQLRAEALLRRFGCLRRVLAAELPALSAVVGAEVALDLRLIHDAARRIAAAELSGRCLLTSWSAVVAYLKLTMAHCEREAFRVLFLDKKNQLIADEVLGHGTVDHAPVYPREVMRRALELSTSALILVHNHPSGDPAPSAADIDMTRQIVAAARVFAIAVHDHVVVGRSDIASFKALGLM